jgi:hypothetical protein
MAIKIFFIVVFSQISTMVRYKTQLYSDSEYWIAGFVNLLNDICARYRSAGFRARDWANPQASQLAGDFVPND